MLGYREGFLEACEEYDYGKAVGRGFQVAGAAASTAGGAMLVAYALGASKFGTAGVVIGALGGLLVAEGYALVHWLQLNINEKFANTSFLGKCWNELPKKVIWSDEQLPTQDPKTEASALVELLAQFSLVARNGGGGGRELEIVFGYVNRQSIFEVHIENRWDNDAATTRIIAAAQQPGDPGIESELAIPFPEQYRLIVDLELDEVVQVMGPRLEPGRVERSAQGQLERILISTREVRPPDTALRDVGAMTLDEVAGVLAGPPGRALLPPDLRSPAYQVATVGVRLLHPDERTRNPRAQYVPASDGTAVQIMLPSAPAASSLDPSTWAPMPQLPGSAK